MKNQRLVSLLIVLNSITIALVLLVGCTTQSTTVQNIKGLYTFPPKDLQAGKYYSGESINLGDGVFSYKIFTDVGDDPRLKDNPRNGHFILDGCLLELRFRDGTRDHLILTQRHGRFLMWSPKDYEEYLRTGRVSDGVLYQQPTK